MGLFLWHDLGLFKGMFVAYFMDCLRGCFRDYFRLKLRTVLACFEVVLWFVSGSLYDLFRGYYVGCLYVTFGLED